MIDKFHNKVQYMFIESICNDEETLRKNVELKLKYSPDYEHTTAEEARLEHLMRMHCSVAVLNAVVALAAADMMYVAGDARLHRPNKGV